MTFSFIVLIIVTIRKKKKIMFPIHALNTQYICSCSSLLSLKRVHRHSSASGVSGEIEVI